MDDRLDGPMPARARGTRAAIVRTSEALDAVLAFIGRTARRLRKLSFVGMAAGPLIWLAIATQVPAARHPTTLVLWALVLLACPAFLFVFSLGLSRLVQVRDRLRSLPHRVGERSEELRRLAREARGATQQGWFRSILSWFRFWRTAAETRELLVALVPARFVFTPWVLVAALFGLIGSVIEIAATPFVALWLLVASAL
jgi:hypothetical protein